MDATAPSPTTSPATGTDATPAPRAPPLLRHCGRLACACTMEPTTGRHRGRLPSSAGRRPHPAGRSAAPAWHSQLPEATQITTKQCHGVDPTCRLSATEVGAPCKPSGTGTQRKSTTSSVGPSRACHGLDHTHLPLQRRKERRNASTRWSAPRLSATRRRPPRRCRCVASTRSQRGRTAPVTAVPLPYRHIGAAPTSRDTQVSRYVKHPNAGSPAGRLRPAGDAPDYRFGSR